MRKGTVFAQFFAYSFEVVRDNGTNHIYSERARQGLQFIRGNHAADSYRFPAIGH